MVRLAAGGFVLFTVAGFIIRFIMFRRAWRVLRRLDSRRGRPLNPRKAYH